MQSWILVIFLLFPLSPSWARAFLDEMDDIEEPDYNQAPVYDDDDDYDFGVTEATTIIITDDNDQLFDEEYELDPQIYQDDDLVDELTTFVPTEVTDNIIEDVTEAMESFE